MERSRRERRRARSAGRAALLLVAAACTPLEVEPEPIRRPTAPLGLDRAVEIALENNPDLRIARQRVLRAAAMVDEAASTFWPDVTASEAFARTDRPSHVFSELLDQGDFAPGIDFNDPGTRSNFRASVGAGWTLYDGGRRKARLARSEAELSALAAGADEVASLVALEVARAWHGAHSARAAVDAHAAAVELLERRLAQREEELSAGAATDLDVADLRLALFEARRAEHGARDAARRAETALGVLLGLGVEERVELLDPIDADEADVAPLSELLARARLARPELVRAEREIEAAVAGLREAEAGYFPELRLSGGLGADDTDARLRHSDWLFGAGLVQQVTEALRTPHRVRGAAAALTAAHEAGRRALLEVEVEVEAAWLDAGDADRALAVARAEVARDELSRARTEAEWEAGAARDEARLAARVALQRARALLRVAELRRSLARISVEHATGDWPAAPAEEEDAS